MTETTQRLLWVLWALGLFVAMTWMIGCAARRPAAVPSPATAAASAPTAQRNSPCADYHRFAMEAKDRIEWLGSMPIVGVFNGQPAGVGIALELEWGLGDNGLLYWKIK